MANEKDTSQALEKLKINHPESFQLIDDLTFCVIDLETTGGNHGHDQIIEIGMVRVQNLKIVKELTFLIRPNIKIPDFIQKLTSITPDKVKDAPSIDEVMPEIVEFISDSILVAHNTSFDIPFLNAVLKRLEMKELTNKSLCTNLMTKYLLPNLMSSNLNYMCQIFQIGHKQAHRAFDDAYASAELLICFLSIYIEKGISKINQLYYPRNKFELDRINIKKSSSLEEIEKTISSIHMPYLFTLKGENGVILMVLPCKNLEREKDYIFEKLKSTNWKTATIKLFGPFIENLAGATNSFNKLDNEMKNEIVNLLWETHLPEHKKKMNVFFNEFLSDTATDDIYASIGDFVIAHHLVPEQLIIFPTRHIHPNSSLVFKFPAHKKKLTQFINSKLHKVALAKMNKSSVPVLLKTFILAYLHYQKEDLPVLYANAKKLGPHHKELVHSINNFLSENTNPYNYPKEHI
jgi:DNA polymerase III subunit epsilon